MARVANAPGLVREAATASVRGVEHRSADLANEWVGAVPFAAAPRRCGDRDAVPVTPEAGRGR
jgi:hypothetical protein